MTRTLRLLSSTTSFIAMLVLPGAGCGPSEDCRFDPAGCGGDIGGNCEDDGDCADGFCCTEDANCGGGMCTQSCDSDADCPDFMACEHDICFFRCDEDRDCAEGQSCEHGTTVCEWP